MYIRLPIKPLLVLLLWCWWCRLAVGEEFVSQFGQQILARCQLVVEGLPLQTVPLNGGGSITEFQVKAVFYGRLEYDKKISIIGRTQQPLLVRQSHVVFLLPLASSTTFEVKGDFVAGDQDGPHKRQAIERLIAIECMPVRSKRLAIYQEYCLAGLTHKSAWFRVHAFCELEHLFAQHQDLASETLLAQLENLYADFPHPELRERFRNLLVRLRQRLPATSSSRPADDPGKQLLDRLYLAPQQIDSPAVDKQQKLELLQLASLFPGPHASKTLLTAINDPAVEIRALAVFYLGIQHCQQARPALLKTLRQDTSWRVRKNAIIALGQLQASEALDDIRPYTAFAYTRDAAQQALRQIMVLAGQQTK